MLLSFLLEVAVTECNEVMYLIVIVIIMIIIILTIIIIIIIIKSVAYSSQGSHTGQLDFSN